MTPDELRAYEQALDDVENPITHPVGAPGSAKRRANDLGLRLKGYEQALAIERERREAAESDAVEDAANAELQLQGALASQPAEERAAGLATALDLRCLRPDSCDSACECCQRRWRAALASRPADERGGERKPREYGIDEYTRAMDESIAALEAAKEKSK